MERYVCMAVMLAGAVAWLICRKKGISRSADIYFLIVICSGALGLAVSLTASSDHTVQDGAITRPQPDGEAFVQEYELSVPDLSLQEKYPVTVERQHLGKEELRQLFSAAEEELMQTFLGENTSCMHVTHPVRLPDTLSDGRIDVSWSFDRYDAVNLEGMLQEDAIDPSGTVVNVTAELCYEEQTELHSFAIHVFPPEKTEAEALLDELSQRLADENAADGETLLLPADIGGHALIWTNVQEHTAYRMLLLGLFALAGVAVGRREDERKAQRRYRQQLAAGYPKMLSQLALLVAAGMTVTHAWERIVVNYENRRSDAKWGGSSEPVYDEMCVTYHQIRDGLGERLAYEQFGERLQLTVYRRFSTLLVQNLRKGTAGLSSLLEKEMEQAFDEQQSLAKKRGEELQTKLLLPMMLMLGLVIVIIMIPALMSFEIS